jgi:K+-transporting ATPase KdpF subunit
MIALFIISIAVFIYMVYVLLKPEKFFKHNEHRTIWNIASFALMLVIRHTAG